MKNDNENYFEDKIVLKNYESKNKWRKIRSKTKKWKKKKQY